MQTSTRVRNGVRRVRRGFNLVEMLIALAITAALMSATLVALDASFMAYQSTTELASTHTIARLTLMRLLTLIRTGQEFGPPPADPTESTVFSDSSEDSRRRLREFLDAKLEAWLGRKVRIGKPVQPLHHEVAYGDLPKIAVDLRQEIGMVQVPPFTLEYKLGRKLFRATIDLLIVPDDNMSVAIDGNSQEQIRLVASAMPRIEAYASR